jgi:hypothetical protein
LDEKETTIQHQKAKIEQKEKSPQDESALQVVERIQENLISN